MMNHMPTANGNGTPCPRNLPQHFNGCSCVAGNGATTAEVDLDLTGMTALMDAENAANGAYDPPVNGFGSETDEMAFQAAQEAQQILADDFALTEVEAYEMNRAQAVIVLEDYEASKGDGDDEGQAERRHALALAAVATASSLDSVRDTLDEAGKHELAHLENAIREHTENPGASTANYLADSLRNALAVGDANIRTYDGKTAARWREQARGGRQRSADSFARSDTDGYLSQWASDTMARKYDACADLAEQGGRAEFIALFDTDGNLVPARRIQTRFGASWMLLDENGDSTGQFVNPSKASTAAKRNAAMAKKGYAEGTIRTKAVVRMSDGMMPTPYFDRVDRGFDPNVEIVSTIDDGPDYD